MELAITDHLHFPLLASLYRSKLKKAAGISRTIQAWHMAHFERPCCLVPNFVDDSLWMPHESLRLPSRVGYMDEGPHTCEYIATIMKAVANHGLTLDFHLIKGTEEKVLSSMQSCQVFLTMNIGKDPLWGEGGPLPPLEGLSIGCVPIAFDIIGPREFIQNGFNGIIVPRYQPDMMADALVNLFKIKGQIEQMRENALSLFRVCHTFDARLPAVKEFLDLK
jgi:glycosyltransferase involved in cell wall biosynthesis